jgi:carboxymethylenebutenolidase
MGGGDATRRIRVPACQMILAVLDHALHADNTWADRVDLATPLSKRVSSAMTAILRRPEASGRIGLLGFSLGGAVAIASARDRRVGAAVIFYGWGLRQLLDRLQSAWQAACLPSRRHRG